MYLVRVFARPAIAMLVGAMAFSNNLREAYAQTPDQTQTGPAPLTAVAPALSVDDAATVLAALRAAPAKGVPAPSTEALAAGLGSSDPAVRDATLTRVEAAAVAYATALRVGRVDPAAIDHDWALRPEPFDAKAELAAALGGRRLRAWLDSLAPSDPAYLALAAARQRYAEAAAAEWPALPGGAVLKIGTTDARVGQLRERLGAEGYPAPAAGDETLFDAPLQAALALFQRQHGLAADGVLSKETLAALNTSAAARLATIDANLERMRWSPRRSQPDRIEVDIAGPGLVLVQGGVETLRMRVIVGNPTHRTPLFTAPARAVVFNPPWIVPTSIATKELWPKIARNPGYMASNGFTAVNGQLRQAPGPKAALGYVKIDIDSPYGVYLHDTPSRSLFSRERRALSHGCIRVQFPRDLATLLLGPQGWSRADVDAAIEIKSTRRIALRAGVPVILSYRTAIANPDGTVSFRPDVYGWDAKLIAALTRR